jgi:NTE family protein
MYFVPGLDFLFFPFSGVAFGAEVNYTRTHTMNIDKKIFPENDNSDFLARAFFEVERLDALIFPSTGIATLVEYQMPFNRFNREQYFTVVKTEGLAAIPLGVPLSMTVRWNVGTDLSFQGGSNRAPFFYLPNIFSRWLFPAPLKATEQFGNHAAGAGIELKYRIDWQGIGITLPLFVLAGGAVGGAVQDTADIAWDKVFHWNATLGFGVRINDAFGVALRGGVFQNTEKQISPCFAIDIGSFSR